MFSVALISLFVFLFVCHQHYSKCYGLIAMKFYGQVQGGKGERVTSDYILVTIWITVLTST